MDKQALSIKEAAETLGISVAKAYQAANSGEIPTVRIGKRILVLVAALERMLERVTSDSSNDN